MNITIVGAGYVGLSLAILISQKYNVKLFDIDKKKILDLNNKKSPINDKEINSFLKEKKLYLEATSDKNFAYKKTDFIIIATPTDYNHSQGTFDVSSVEGVIKDAISYNPDAYIIIKSTVPVGFTNKMRSHFNTKNITFSPEFLREGSALFDNLYPSRIIVGDNDKRAITFAEILTKCSSVSTEQIKILYMKSSEAEAVKLFANTYLAMRVSFFNELDSFAQSHILSAKNIIEGVSSDNRIGNFYNNPSFGYGGYCLPKDTKQLLSNFDNIPNSIIKAIIDSNETRKEFIANTIINKQPKSIGVFRLTMKSGSDNFRESAVLDVIKKLQKNKIDIYLYEPELHDQIENTILVNNLKEFIEKSDLIIANRMSTELSSVKEKVYTRDLFGEN
mgnify:CR=1 FL=1